MCRFDFLIKNEGRCCASAAYGLRAVWIRQMCCLRVTSIVHWWYNHIMMREIFLSTIIIISTVCAFITPSLFMLKAKNPPWILRAIFVPRFSLWNSYIFIKAGQKSLQSIVLICWCFVSSSTSAKLCIVISSSFKMWFFFFFWGSKWCTVLCECKQHALHKQLQHILFTICSTIMYTVEYFTLPGQRWYSDAACLLWWKHLPLVHFVHT